MRFNNGLHIENYIDNIRHNNKVLRENIDLISQFLSGYEKYHVKYLSTLEIELDSLYCKLIQDVTPKERRKSIYEWCVKGSSKGLKIDERIREKVVKYLKMAIKLNIVVIYMLYKKII